MYKILLADLDLIPAIENELISYNIDIAYDINSFYDFTYKNHYDLYILNYYYYDSYKTLKDMGDKTVTLFIDEYYDIYHLKNVFQIADDYLIKPLNFQEIKIRIAYQMKKLFNIQKEVIVYKKMYFHIHSKQLYDNNKKVKLSPNEVKLLEYFLSRINTPLPKENILKFLESSSEGTLRVYISKLNKLGFEITYKRANASYTLNEC
ncbi:Two-component system response regulator DccR [hydrothermal vent metagenome]|uniref:Two-component system response regulator DccR n=1 Tax=hydrothermal vent metagenome TaxID=652676 RepID=A0A1W1CEU0_9ZZZZ